MCARGKSVGLSLIRFGDGFGVGLRGGIAENRRRLGGGIGDDLRTDSATDLGVVSEMVSGFRGALGRGFGVDLRTHSGTDSAMDSGASGIPKLQH